MTADGRGEVGALTEAQALGLSDIANGGDIGFIHSHTWRALRGKGFVYQQSDGSMALTSSGETALSDAIRRWPVLLATPPTTDETRTP